jgi:hypothetical protein
MTCPWWAPALALSAAVQLPAQVMVSDALPDSPGAVFSTTFQSGQTSAIPCSTASTPAVPQVLSQPPSLSGMPCPKFHQENPYRPFVSSPVLPLTSSRKAYLAVHDVIDPFNILTIVANSAITIGFDSHTAFGPGWEGFGRSLGVSFVEDATGEAIGTYAVCSIFRQDPRYFRMPNARPLRRVGHVLAHVVVAQGDNGRPMLNFENLITYPASAEIANLYVPGIHDNGASTIERILTGLATEPIGNFIAEFLPDLARRVHFRVLIVQQLINGIASGQPL